MGKNEEWDVRLDVRSNGMVKKTKNLIGRDTICIN